MLPPRGASPRGGASLRIGLGETALPVAGSPSRPAYGSELLQARGPSRRKPDSGVPCTVAPTARPGEQPPPPGRTPRLGQGWPGGAPPRLLVRGAPRPFAAEQSDRRPRAALPYIRRVDRWEVRMPGCVGEWDHRRYGRSSRRSSAQATAAARRLHARDYPAGGSTRRPFAVALSGNPGIGGTPWSGTYDSCRSSLDICGELLPSRSLGRSFRTAAVTGRRRDQPMHGSGADRSVSPRLSPDKRPLRTLLACA
jgi:hypothetical protein